jgi:hypothetical protein
MKIVRGTHIIVKSEEGIKGHIDGEPIMLPNEIEVLVNQGALNIIYNPAISMLELISNKIKNI